MKKSTEYFALASLIILVITGCELRIEPIILFDDRENFIGDYEVEEYSESASSRFFYDIYIHKSDYPDNKIWIENLYDTNISVFATVEGNKIYIPRQRVGVLEFEGRGTLYWGNELSISYSIREIRIGPDYVDYLTCTAWKY